MLTSGKTDFKAESIKTLEVEMRASKDETLQFFFVADGKPFNEAASYKLRLGPPGSELKTYKIDLTTNPHWKGTISQLRLDPVVGSGVEVSIKAIRLLAD
jgi:hypothetical protein